MIIFDRNTKDLEIPAGLGNLEVNIISGGTGSGVSSLDGQTGALTLKTINGNGLLGTGDISISGSPEEVISSAVTEANTYTDNRIGELRIPDKTSDLENDSGFITSAETANFVTSAQTKEQIEEYHYATSADTEQAISTATQNMVVSTSIRTIWVGTSQQYEAITTKDPNTLYFINDN